MYRVAICDDEAFFRSKLTDLLKKNIPSKGLIIKEYCNGEDFLEDFYNEEHFDVIFMDICMDGVNGEEVVREVRRLEKNRSIIVFITSIISDISRIVELQPNAYIYKNKSDEYVISKIKQIFEDAYLGKEILEFISNRCLHRVKYSEIEYIESYKNEISITTMNGTYVTRSFSLRQVNEILDSKKLVQCSSSAIVNYDYVRTITSNSLVMQDGKIFSIGRKYKNNIISI